MALGYKTSGSLDTTELIFSKHFFYQQLGVKDYFNIQNAHIHFIPILEPWDRE